MLLIGLLGLTEVLTNSVDNPCKLDLHSLAKLGVFTLGFRSKDLSVVLALDVSY